jgi:hypothetical protein
MHLMIDTINTVRKTGGFIPRSTTEPNRKSKYSIEYKRNALALQKSLGSRNKAAKELGLAPSMLSTFARQRDEGEF